METGLKNSGLGSQTLNSQKTLELMVDDEL